MKYFLAGLTSAIDYSLGIKLHCDFIAGDSLQGLSILGRVSFVDRTLFLEWLLGQKLCSRGDIDF